MTTFTLASPSLRRIAYAALTAALLTFLILQAAAHGSWAVLTAGLIAPDLALAFGGGRGLQPGQLHPRAVGVYNAVHRFWGPAALTAIAAGGVLGPGWIVLGLAWATHVALDRAVGYRLRDARGFQRGD